VIRSEQRHGYAATLEMLLREAVRRSEYPKRDVVVTLQADFSDEPDDIVPLLKRLEAGADVAIGNKISKSKPTRMRQLTRSLASFFMRKLKLPEGVATPFDGYRAYRVYSVRRALEERTGKRLVRYDGWAAHAELLRAVLPHARRVDVVDVVDRTDRLQRPRREQPFAAAMQVRAMAGDREPAGLIGVEELDRIAATASRSRERGTVASMAEYAQRAPATNGGGRNRQRRPEGRPQGDRQRGRQQAEGPAPQRSRQRAEGGEQRQRPPRQPGEQKTPRPTSSGEEGQKRQSRRGRGQKIAAETVEPSLEIEIVAAAPEPAAAENAPARPKKKRRRRRRGSGAGTGGAAAVGQETAGGEEMAADEAGEPAVEAGEGTATGERKRRRRGGRRGGRGRKRGPRAGTEGTGGAEGVVTEGAASTPAAPPEAPTRSDNDGDQA
jgi:hypothetical protein